MSTRKRQSSAVSAASKRAKNTTSMNAPPIVVTSSTSSSRSNKLKDPPPTPDPVSSLEQPTSSSSLKERFLQLFESHPNGISNSLLKEHFSDDEEYIQLVPIINELTRTSRLNMSKAGPELFYTLVSTDVAVKFQGLDAVARMVYQVIEKAGNMGCWTKDIRVQTSIQQNALSKILKSLESRRLIKPVKSVTAKSKKLYMLYDLTPSKELTGGIWYSDLEFDHEFINELRSFLMHCIRRLNGGKGVSLQELHNRMVQAQVSRVALSVEELQQLLQTLVHDYMVEEVEDTATTDGVLYVPARRISVPCDFKWWEAIEPDFHFRKITFEDGVVLPPHEQHYHTA